MLNKIKIGTKLTGGFMIVCALALLVGVFGINNMGKLNDMLNLMYNDHLLGISEIKEANVNLVCIGRAIRQLVAAEDTQEKEKLFRDIEEFRKNYENELSAAKDKLVTKEGQKVYGEALDAFKEFMTQISEFKTVIFSQENLNVDLKVKESVQRMRGVVNTADEKMTELSKLKEDYGAEMQKESDETYAKMRNIMIFIVIFAVAFGVFIGIFLSRNISNPLGKVVCMLDELEKGHLGIRLNLDRTDEIGVLAKTMDSFADDLKNNVVATMQQIADGDVSADIEIKDNQDEIMPALRKTIESIKKLINETETLASEAVKGNLSIRGKQDEFKGAYKKVILGLNDTLDSILTPIEEATQVLQKVANRDMSSRMVGDYKGDHAKIKNALNTTVENLDQALTQVSEATEQVSSASQQISEESQSLAQGANEQASSLEEVSSSLEEMASMTKQNSGNANQAKNLSGEADLNAQSGIQSMGKMDDAIKRIKKSSDQTAKIVKTIDEIAMQTNLLALNAAVEAARAGEAGRGFAVVAEEVRNLAQRSAQAAKNTADMISESVKNADDGVGIAEEVAKSFELIATSSKKVNDLIAEIAAASQEQSQGIDQVNTAVAQMDKVTQQNAANSEESASAAEELSSQAEELQNMVTQFKLTNSTQNLINRHVANKTQSKDPIVQKKNNNLKLNQKKNGKKNMKTVNPDDIIPMDEEVLKEF